MLSAILLPILVSHKVFNYKDKPPETTAHQEVFLFKECHELSHYRVYDYIIFEWWDKATLCEFDTKHKVCTAISATEYRAYRKGCIVREAKGKDRP